jgi:hypothetical protein
MIVAAIQIVSVNLRDMKIILVVEHVLRMEIVFVILEKQQAFQQIVCVMVIIFVNN